MRFSSILYFAIGSKTVTAFWMEDIARRGRSPYHPDPSYLTFRNVKDFGVVGDGGISCWLLGEPKLTQPHSSR